MDYYSFNRPRRDGRLSRPCWLTDSGRFTHKEVTRPWARIMLFMSPLIQALFDCVVRYKFIYVCTLFQLQHFIELIRRRQCESALEYAQGHLASAMQADKDKVMLDRLERAMALLAFDDPAESPFSDLLLESQRHKVSDDLCYLLIHSFIHLMTLLSPVLTVCHDSVTMG